MATSISPRTAAFFEEFGGNVVPLRPGRSSTPIVRAGRSRAEPRCRKAFAFESCWDSTEAAILSAVSWLGTLVVEGLIHCAFVNHAGDPKLIQQILDDRKMTANAEGRMTVREIRP